MKAESFHIPHGLFYLTVKGISFALQRSSKSIHLKSYQIFFKV